MTPASKGAQVKRVSASRSAASGSVTGREQKRRPPRLVQQLRSVPLSPKRRQCPL